MTKAGTHPGICGFVTTIEVTKSGKRRVSVNIVSDCEKVSKLKGSLAELDAWDPLKGITDSEVHRQASRFGLHSTCPVPIAILKTIEVETGLALCRDVAIHFETSEHDRLHVKNSVERK